MKKIIFLITILFFGVDTSTAWKRFTRETKQARSKKTHFSFNRTKSFFNRIKASIFKSASAVRLANFIKKYKKPIKKIALTGTGLAVGIKLKQTLTDMLSPNKKWFGFIVKNSG